MDLVPIAMIVSAAQDAVRRAPAGDRRGMWQAFQAGLAAAKEDAPDRMPWEPPEEVKVVTRASAAAALSAMFREISSKAEALRLIKLTGARLEAAEEAARRNPATAKDPPGRYGRVQCARPGCGATFSPKHPTAKYCSGTCRHAAYLTRKKTTVSNAKAR